MLGATAAVALGLAFAPGPANADELRASPIVVDTDGSATCAVYLGWGYRAFCVVPR